MEEINRRSMYHEEGGVACSGPFSITAIDAEIVVDDDGKTVYLHAQWVDEASEYLLLEATTQSTYDIYEKLNDAKGEEYNSLIAQRDKICESQIKDDSRYTQYYEELKQMLLDEMRKHDIEWSFDEDEG